MANDSDDCKNVFNFQPTEAPHGMLFYRLDTLNTEMQNKTTEHKANMMREDKFYLSEHPEIKVLISMIIKAVLKYRPAKNLHIFLATYFGKPKFEIEQRMNKYLNLYQPTYNPAIPSGVSLGDGGVSSSSVFYKVKGSEIRMNKNKSDFEVGNNNKVMKTILSDRSGPIVENYTSGSKLIFKESKIKGPIEFSDTSADSKTTPSEYQAKESKGRIKSTSRVFINENKSDPSLSYLNKMYDYVLGFQEQSSSMLPHVKSLNSVLSRLATTGR